jgi:ATP-binding protein involved in chromosome partitioning
MQVADELGVRLRELAEGAVQELDAHAPLRRTVARTDRGLEPEAMELLLECAQAAARAGTPPGLGPPRAARIGGVFGIGADALREGGEQCGEQRVRRRIESHARSTVGEEVEVLGTADGATVGGLDVDDADVAQALEVEAHGVGVDPEPIGEILSRQGPGGGGELPVDGVTRLVGKRLENRQLHDVDVSQAEAYFQDRYCFLGTNMTMHPDPNDPGAPVHTPEAGPAPTVDDVRRALAGVIDPELKVSITELGMVDDVLVDADGTVTVRVALTTAGCPLRNQISREVESKVRGLRGVASVAVEYAEMTQEQKSAAMARARFQAREDAAPTEVSASTRVLAVASGKGGVGKSSVTVNLAAALAARGLRVGVLDADIWGFSVPRMLGVEGRLGGAEGKIHPHVLKIAGVSSRASARGRGIPARSERGHGGGGEIHVVSMGFLVDDEGTALMWRGLVLTKALEQFLTDVRWGELDYLLVDMPPGTGDIQMGLARMLPQAEMLVVTTPGLAAQRVAVRVADMAHRSYMKIVGVVENMTEFVAPDGERFALFGSGGGAALAEEIGAPLVAQIPIEPAVASGSDEGVPVALRTPDSPAGKAFDDLAARVVDELLPPIEMAGCTARILDLAAEAARS